MLSVIIPSFNRRESMLALLGDLEKQSLPEFETIVVDDQSSDGSVEAIRERFTHVKVLVNETNGGPAVTRNRGIGEARHDIIVGFDSDVSVPDRDCLAKVKARFARAPVCSGLAFRLLQPNGDEDTARWWHPLPYERFAEQEFETHYFSGTGYAFRKDDVVAAGLYPEELYMHYEEVLLAYRLLDLGKPIRYCPEVSVVHHEGQVSRRSEIKTYYKHRNQLLLAYALYPSLRALGFVIPRSANAFLISLAGGHFSSYLRSLHSAMSMIRRGKITRQPLSGETWAYLSRLRKPPAASPTLSTS